MEFGSFPKNLAYNVKTLSGFSKTIVKMTPTPNTAVSAGQTLKVRLPSNSLVDLRTLTMYYEGTCTNSSGTGTGFLRFPRLSSSIIDTLNIYINGTLIENITDYGHLYNSLYDLSCAGDQTAKRFLENSDPSILVDNGATDITCSTYKATSFGVGGKASHATAQPFYINNWLGFISSASTPVIDTNDTGVIELELRLKSRDILWSTNGDAVGTLANLSNPNYSIDNVVFTIQKIVFNDPLYYNMKASKLLGDGLTIGYNTYICSKSSSQAKGTSMNIQANINTTSLDQLICTTAPNDANPLANLLLQTAGGSDDRMVTFTQAKSGLNGNITTYNPFETTTALADTSIEAAAVVCTTADVRIGDYVFVNGFFTTGQGNLSGFTDVTTQYGYMWYKVSSIVAGTGGTSQSVPGVVTKFDVTFLNGAAVTYTAGVTTNRTISIVRGTFNTSAPIVPYINQTVVGYNDYTSGDLFNQSVAYRRNLLGLVTSSVEINNVPLTPIPLKPAEVFNETLIALGNANLDMSAGIHEGCFSISHFLKYYGTHIVSLENIQSDAFYKSGLDGKSSALNINWKPSFSGNTETIIPVIYAKTTRMLVINEGHNITCIV